MEHNTHTIDHLYNGRTVSHTFKTTDYIHYTNPSDPYVIPVYNFTQCFTLTQIYNKTT